MAVIKLTGSKKAVLFIDDFGNVFISSVGYVAGLMAGKAPGNCVKLSRLPYTVPADKFGVSDLYNPNGVLDPRLHTAVSGDIMSPKNISAKKDAVNFDDKVIEW